MRNIALLEWGPASLFYIEPRELIKVRSKWLDGGPSLPPFLSTMEEAKAGGPDIVVRYAFSAFEDLNSAIKNLRCCFGFPYQEYIGYLNTLTQNYRARREHEVLIDRLRRWAMFGNVDAVFWIDYCKANQPPGSFKMGPKESRPFSPAHMQLCVELPKHLDNTDADDESEAAWSDQDEEHPSGQPRMDDMATGAQGSRDGSIILQPREPGSLRPFPPKRLPKNVQNVRTGHLLSTSGTIRAPPAPTASPSSKSAAVTEAAEEAVAAVQNSSELAEVMGHTSRDKIREKTKDERSAFQLQEEYVPGPGSIYTRSIVPGPGYYGAPKAPQEAAKEAPSFGRKPKSLIDEVTDASAKLPGPGHYKTDEVVQKGKLGCFNKAAKLVATMHTKQKLPFISHAASVSEGYGLDSSQTFHCVGVDDASSKAKYRRPPKFSFGKTRRPF